MYYSIIFKMLKVIWKNKQKYLRTFRNYLLYIILNYIIGLKQCSNDTK